MSGKYNEHFLMSIEDVIDYSVEEVKYFDSMTGLVAEEIGDGNINYVFRVRDTNTGKSIVIKQADKLLRASGRPLDLHRNKIEATIMEIESKLAPGFVPEIYHYNEKMYALAMEDISAYKNLRKELMLGKTFNNFADEITHFIVETTIPTTDLVLNAYKKKENVKLFINYDCCDISEDLVFTKPYGDYKGRNKNIVTSGNEDYVKKHLYENEALHTQVGFLRNNFMNNTQALIHGDLHSGSIFINQKGTKVIDPEFAFYGPIGYDIGNVIGNLYFSWAYIAHKQKSNAKFINFVKDTIIKIFDLSKVKLEAKINELVDFPLYTNDFKQHYMKGIISDSLGYAGTEIIRRTIGDSKVAELDTLEVNEDKLEIERNLIDMGIWFIMNRKLVNSGQELVDTFEKILSKK